MHPTRLLLCSLAGVASLADALAIGSARLGVRAGSQQPAALQRRSEDGTATFYGGLDGGMGACLYENYTLPSGVYGAAFANWDNAAHCGACVKVKGPNGKTITVQIVDQCPNCVHNHLDLFPDAFKQIANPTDGNVTVTWDFVTCPIDTPFNLVEASGVSPYWFSIQPVGINKEVKSVDVSKDGGSTYMSTKRTQSNTYEIASGAGPGPVTVKVTAHDGETIIVDDVPIGPNEKVQACSNFAND